MSKIKDSSETIGRNAPPPPPLFYRDGRKLTDEERGIAQPVRVEPESASHLSDPFADIKPWKWTDWLLPAAVVGVVMIGTILLRVSLIGLVLAAGTFGALAKIR